ncbi:MAG: hypothetical protein WAV92_13670, partial [Halopseudomonas yangmingensis]
VLRRYGGKWAKNRQIMRKCCLKFTFFAGQCLDWRNAAFIQTFPNNNPIPVEPGTPSSVAISFHASGNP